MTQKNPTSYQINIYDNPTGSEHFGDRYFSARLEIDYDARTVKVIPDDPERTKISVSGLENSDKSKNTRLEDLILPSDFLNLNNNH